MIEIVSYRAEWPAEFERVASIVQAGLGALALRIDHVGSTAVPGLSSRNIIKPNQRYALLFRDYVIAHVPVAASCAEVKRRLASSLADDEAYPAVKDPAVDLIYFAAEQWATAAQWRLQ